MPTMTASKATGGAGNLFAGAGLGLLLGLIAGLSVSPVVSVLLGALAALLAAFLGLSGGAADSGADPARLAAEQLRQGQKNLRAGSFGIACVLGIVAGVALRVGDAFAPSLQAEIEAWTAAGYADSEARQFVAFERLGVTPDWREVKFDEAQRRRSGALFSGDGDAELCAELRPQRYANDSAEVLYAWGDMAPPALPALAARIETLKLPEEQLVALLAATAEALCSVESE